MEKDGITLHLDHITPVSRGGTNHPSNLQTLCEECNLGKSDSTMAELKSGKRHNRSKEKKRQREERELAERLRLEQQRREALLKEERWQQEIKRQREEKRKKRQEFIHEHENLIVVGIFLVVVLLCVLGIVGLHYAGKRVQATRQAAQIAEQQRLAAEKQIREDQERLVAEQKAREEQERLEAERRKKESQKIQRLLEEQRQRELQKRQQIAAEAEAKERELLAIAEAEKKQEEEKKRANAFNLNEEVSYNNFDSVDEYVQYGSNALQNELFAAHRARREVDPLDDLAISMADIVVDTVNTKIKKAQAVIVSRIYFYVYPFSISQISNHGNGTSSLRMSIDTAIEHPKIEKVSFPMQDVQSDCENLVWFDSILIRVRGKTENIRELVNNKNQHRAKVWLANLRESGTKSSADVLEIQIIKVK